MNVPPKPVVRAASRWLEYLAQGGEVSRGMGIFANHKSYDDLSMTQYASALTWLRDLKLVPFLRPQGATVAGIKLDLLRAIFEESPPHWVRDADVLVPAADDLPQDIVEVGRIIDIGPDAVFEQLLTSWGKVDTAARERVGLAGETALVAALTSSGLGTVDHVSLRSDGYGFDVAYTTADTRSHIEVKTSTRRGRFTAYLSRHEYAVMLRDQDWMLVAIRLDDDLTLKSVGSVTKNWIQENVPQDAGFFGAWSSCKLEVPDEEIGRPVRSVCAALDAERLIW